MADALLLLAGLSAVLIPVLLLRRQRARELDARLRDHYDRMSGRRLPSRQPPTGLPM